MIIRNILFIVLVTLFVNATTSTTRLLEEKGEMYVEKLIKGENKELAPFFHAIASQEDETFFAYHGMSHYVSAIQDIIKVIYEETNGTEVAKDFVFWRIPHNSSFDLGDDVKSSYLNKRNSALTIENRNALAEHFIFSPLNLPVKDLGEELDALFLHFYHCHMFPERIDREEERAIIEALALAIDPVLTDSLMELLSYDSITKAGKTKKKKKKLYEKFLPSSPFFLNYLYYFYDATTMSNFVVSCSPALFSGEPAESALWTFIGNHSIECGDLSAIFDLHAYAKEVGISPEVIDTLLGQVMEIIEASGVKTGVLCQIFDDSSPRFSIANNCSYLSIASGHPIKGAAETPVQALVDGAFPFKYHGHELQVRLIVDNNHLLNPNSPVRTVKHSQLSEETKDRIQKLIRKTIGKYLPIYK